MQYTVNEVVKLFFIALVALASTLITELITKTYESGALTTMVVVIVTAVALYTFQIVTHSVALSNRTLRWLLDPRAAIEGFWIERVESPVQTEGRTYSLLKIEYNAALSGYAVFVWNFDVTGREIRWVSSSQVDFSAGFQSIIYRFDGSMLAPLKDREVSDAQVDQNCHPGANALTCSGFGHIKFMHSRFGKFSFARGEFIDRTPAPQSNPESDDINDAASLDAAYPRRLIKLRRLRDREISKTLTEDSLARDPRWRIRSTFSWRPYREPYKNHDLARIVLAFMRQTRLQDESLESLVMRNGQK